MTPKISIQTKLKEISAAGLKAPTFPYSHLPPGYNFELSDVAKFNQTPAANPSAQLQRINQWLRDVDKTWKKLPK